MPNLSIITPIYNTQKYLNRCLDSLINQTLKDIEIICINDCSTDNSLEILKEYQNKDKRIKIINLKENKKQGYARNIALNEANGEYIGFIDSDDWIDLNYFEKLFVYTRHIHCDDTFTFTNTMNIVHNILASFWQIFYCLTRFC